MLLTRPKNMAESVSGSIERIGDNQLLLEGRNNNIAYSVGMMKSHCLVPKSSKKERVLQRKAQKRSKKEKVDYKDIRRMVQYLGKNLSLNGKIVFTDPQCNKIFSVIVTNQGSLSTIKCIELNKLKNKKVTNMVTENYQMKGTQKSLMQMMCSELQSQYPFTGKERLLRSRPTKLKDKRNEKKGLVAFMRNLIGCPICSSSESSENGCGNIYGVNSLVMNEPRFVAKRLSNKVKVVNGYKVIADGVEIDTPRVHLINGRFSGTRGKTPTVLEMLLCTQRNANSVKVKASQEMKCVCKECGQNYPFQEKMKCHTTNCSHNICQKLKSKMKEQETYPCRISLRKFSCRRCSCKHDCLTRSRSPQSDMSHKLKSKRSCKNTCHRSFSQKSKSNTTSTDEDCQFHGAQNGCSNSRRCQRAKSLGHLVLSKLKDGKLCPRRNSRKSQKKYHNKRCEKSKQEKESHLKLKHVRLCPHEKSRKKCERKNSTDSCSCSKLDRSDSSSKAQHSRRRKKEPFCLSCQKCHLEKKRARKKCGIRLRRRKRSKCRQECNTSYKCAGKTKNKDIEDVNRGRNLNLRNKSEKNPFSQTRDNIRELIEEVFHNDFKDESNSNGSEKLHSPTMPSLETESCCSGFTDTERDQNNSRERYKKSVENVKKTKCDARNNRPSTQCPDVPEDSESVEQSDQDDLQQTHGVRVTKCLIPAVQCKRTKNISFDLGHIRKQLNNANGMNVRQSNKYEKNHLKTIEKYFENFPSMSKNQIRNVLSFNKDMELSKTMLCIPLNSKKYHPITIKVEKKTERNDENIEDEKVKIKRDMSFRKQTSMNKVRAFERQFTSKNSSDRRQKQGKNGISNTEPVTNTNVSKHELKEKSENSHPISMKVEKKTERNDENIVDEKVKIKRDINLRKQTSMNKVRAFERQFTSKNSSDRRQEQRSNEILNTEPVTNTHVSKHELKEKSENYHPISIKVEKKAERNDENIEDEKVKIKRDMSLRKQTSMNKVRAFERQFTSKNSTYGRQTQRSNEILNTEPVTNTHVSKDELKQKSGTCCDNTMLFGGKHPYYCEQEYEYGNNDGNTKQPVQCSQSKEQMQVNDEPVPGYLWSKAYSTMTKFWSRAQEHTSGLVKRHCDCLHIQTCQICGRENQVYLKELRKQMDNCRRCVAELKNMEKKGKLRRPRMQSTEIRETYCCGECVNMSDQKLEQNQRLSHKETQSRNNLEKTLRRFDHHSRNHYQNVQNGLIEHKEPEAIQKNEQAYKEPVHCCPYCSRLYFETPNQNLYFKIHHDFSKSNNPHREEQNFKGHLMRDGLCANKEVCENILLGQPHHRDQNKNGDQKKDSMVAKSNQQNYHVQHSLENNGNIYRYNRLKNQKKTFDCKIQSGNLENTKQINQLKQKRSLKTLVREIKERRERTQGNITASKYSTKKLRKILKWEPHCSKHPTTSLESNVPYSDDKIKLLVCRKCLHTEAIYTLPGKLKRLSLSNSDTRWDGTCICCGDGREAPKTTTVQPSCVRAGEMEREIGNTVYWHKQREQAFPTTGRDKPQPPFSNANSPISNSKPPKSYFPAHTRRDGVQDLPCWGLRENKTAWTSHGDFLLYACSQLKPTQHRQPNDWGGMKDLHKVNENLCYRCNELSL